MNRVTLQKILILIAAALLLLAVGGCKSESSPTAPTTSTQPPSGGVSPPTGATVALSVSNANPLVSSRVTITATVTVNNAPAPDGTAVQFTTSIGTFSDTGQNTTIRTTTNGVATAILSSASAGTAVITATVNNVTKQTQVTFSTAPVTPVPPNTTPTITGVTPTFGLPTGGQQVTITGTNFRAPVRVLFDPGNGQPAKEAFVVSVTPTQIVVVSPSFDITTGQTLPVTVTVIDEAGTSNEVSVSSANAFTYQLQVLTPVIRALSPTSGPIDGGTRVTIIGDAFQAPVQVFFNSAEAQVISITFNQIIVIAPTARDTSSNGSGTVTGPVDVRVLNVGSGKSVTATAAFRYVAKMQITAVNPTVGSAIGGTDITIDGIGFNDPVTVNVGPIRAQVLRVSGTQILARTGPLPSPCTTSSAALPITVTNVDNGDTATSVTPQVFTYVGVPAVITSVSGPGSPVPGNSLTVNVQNPGIGLLGTANIAFTVGGQPAVVTPQTISTGTGTQSFNVIIPSGLTFPTVACTAGGFTGTQLGPTTFAVVFTNTTTGCISNAGSITVNPPAPNTCNTIPPQATVTAPVPPTCANAGTSAVGTTSATAPTITIANTAASGGSTLQITGLTIGGTNPGDFLIAPVPSAGSPSTAAPGASTTFVVNFKPTATGARSATATFNTNDPARPTVTVCLTGTGT